MEPAGCGLPTPDLAQKLQRFFTSRSSVPTPWHHLTLVVHLSALGFWMLGYVHVGRFERGDNPLNTSCLCDRYLFVMEATNELSGLEFKFTSMCACTVLV